MLNFEKFTFNYVHEHAKPENQLLRNSTDTLHAARAVQLRLNFDMQPKKKLNELRKKMQNDWRREEAINWFN